MQKTFNYLLKLVAHQDIHPENLKEDFEIGWSKQHGLKIDFNASNLGCNQNRIDSLPEEEVKKYILKMASAYKEPCRGCLKKDILFDSLKEQYKTLKDEQEVKDNKGNFEEENTFLLSKIEKLSNEVEYQKKINEILKGHISDLQNNLSSLEEEAKDAFEKIQNETVERVNSLSLVEDEAKNLIKEINEKELKLRELNNVYEKKNEKVQLENEVKQIEKEVQVNPLPPQKKKKIKKIPNYLTGTVSSQRCAQETKLKYPYGNLKKN
jgi:chromosome segregation ATPase